MRLLTKEETKQQIREYMDSHEWWTIVAGDSKLPKAIEDKYYTGEKNAQFHLIILSPSPMIAVFFARKKEMSAYQLAQIVVELQEKPEPVGALAEDLINHDVLVPGYGEQMIALADAFAEWMDE
jgi:hypothetical protein